TFVLDLDNFIGHGTVSISNSLTGLNESISWIIKRHDIFGSIQTGISKIETTPSSNFASATVFAVNRIEITIPDPTFNNSSVLITFPSSVNVRRTRLSA